MGLITTYYRDNAWDIRYSNNPETGVYVTTVRSDIDENCKHLQIGLANESGHEGQHRLDEFETFFVYTSQVGGKPFQYFFLDSAAEGYIVEFAEKLPSKIAARIYKRLGLELES